MTTNTKQPRAKVPRVWIYLGAIIAVILLLSLLPGGGALALLVIPIVGWATTIWLFRNSKIVRLLVIVSGIIIATGILIAVFANNGLSSLGY